jgi:protein tyrosine phosphatase (PTP) superfamily phosphohydrolase (DUF442 family)
MKPSRILLAAGVAAAICGAAGAILRESYLDWRHAPQAVVEGALYRARQPRPDDWSAIARMGITHVVDLRPPEERDDGQDVYSLERQACRQAGLELTNLHVHLAVPSDEQLEQFLRIARGPGRVLVHCAQGKVRTGTVVAAYRIVVQGWSWERAYGEMLNVWHGLPEHYKRELQRQELLIRLQRDRAQWLARTAP